MTLLLLQIAYCAMGVGYNVVSWLMTAKARKPLSPTRPAAGVAVMLAYALALVPGFVQQRALYGALMVLALIVLGYGGVVSHLKNRSRMELYHSESAWAVAIAINLFGAVLNAVAVVAAFV